MEGLEIIERIAITQVPDSVMFCLVLGLFSILIPTYMVWLWTKSVSKTIIIEIISGVVYMILLSALMVSGVLERPTGGYQYRVRITEDVGYIEFTDKYEVITENDDGTYIIQEKNYTKE